MIALAALVLFVVAVAPCLVIVVVGLRDGAHQADLAVVLGNKVESDGSPSPMLKARLDHAVELYREGYFQRVLVSGGHKEGYDEALSMGRYLEANGVPREAIFEDNKGFNTWETARNTAAFLHEHHLTSVLVVSQYFHMPRCRLAFTKFGIAPVYLSPARYWSVRDFWSVPREVAGYVVYYLRRVKAVGE
jgi:vancomycin permeability regulator SanA